MEVILAIAPKVSLEPNAMLTLMNVTKVRKEKLIPLIFSKSNSIFDVLMYLVFQLLFKIFNYMNRRFLGKQKKIMGSK